MIIPFFKYQGTGNDFVILNNLTAGYESQLKKEDVAFMCDRRFGIGADGLMLLSPSREHDFQMVYYNSDGSESSMCGNGGRCIVSLAKRLGIIENTCRFMATDGLHEAEITGDWVRLKMSPPQGFQQLSESTCQVDTGSPHYVHFLEENEGPLADFDVFSAGKSIRYNETYRSEGINVNFVHAVGPAQIDVRTYERGVEDETLSCGTGVTACAYTHMRMNGGEDQIQVNTPGGNLQIEVLYAGSDKEEVFLCGPATFVFTGEIALSL